MRSRVDMPALDAQMFPACRRSWKCAPLMPSVVTNSGQLTRWEKFERRTGPPDSSPVNSSDSGGSPTKFARCFNAQVHGGISTPLCRSYRGLAWRLFPGQERAVVLGASSGSLRDFGQENRHSPGHVGVAGTGRLARVSAWVRFRLVCSDLGGELPDRGRGAGAVG